jgi:hypothetical protein
MIKLPVVVEQKRSESVLVARGGGGVIKLPKAYILNRRGSTHSINNSNKEALSQFKMAA